MRIDTFVVEYQDIIPYMNKLYGFLFLVLLVVSGMPATAQQTINDSLYHYQLTLSDSLVQWHDSASAAEHESIFYNNNPGLVFMITVREGLFTTITSYLDCTSGNL